MINRLRLSNFKAFQELDIQLRPLTFLVGPNNTGKSSIIAAIRLLAQTLDAADPRVALLLDGPLGDFGTFRDVVHGNRTQTSFEIEVGGIEKEGLYIREPDGPPVEWAVRTEFRYRSKRRQLILGEVELADEQGHILTVSYVPGSDRHIIKKLAGVEIPARFRSTQSADLRMSNFLPVLFYYRRAEPPYGGLIDMDVLRDVDLRVDRVTWALRRSLATSEYISAMREPPARTYHQTGEGRARIGAAGENWAGILVLDSSRSGAGTRNLIAKTGEWLQDAGMADGIALNWLSDRHYEVKVRHPITGEAENLADVGQGNSQVIPVLIGGLRLGKESLYMVEEPEIHLHPQAQAELGDYFVGLNHDGINVLVETHSEYLLLRVQQWVAAGDIDPDNVAFYKVYAGRGGQKRTKKLTLDSEARFKQSMGKGFFPQRLSEARKLARLRAK